ncbi:hypothetical protein HUT18_32885 [Streptomyces sp. NA04227]|uniref:hypothetical protein n=1 Tax=Streptomyces sp. NA04227 TaxID=2742136 RepID=UPI0015902AF3|nr:hypothetical protein [Streptomyces sp. NA04227]QKW10504.1 hypothetical protein HUT18_32885 [Streptomyces sp. NA04227]
MALNANPVPPDDELLPCGRSLESLWAAHDENGPADPHVAHCPHCTAALDELHALDEVVRQARTAEEDPEDASRLTRRVMDIVRLELRPGRSLPLGEADEDLWIVEAAAAKSFRSAADSVPGVRAGSCQVLPLTPGAGRVRGPVAVRLDIAAALSWNLQEVAEAVRAAVSAAADRSIGLEVRTVDVSVVDVLDEDQQDGGGSR